MSSRKVLVEQDKVYCPSLPRSLRHVSQHDALESARQLAILLYEITFLSRKDGLCEDAMDGLMNVQGLLLDKLETGMGAYKFPFLTWGDESSLLAEREDLE